MKNNHEKTQGTSQTGHRGVDLMAVPLETEMRLFHIQQRWLRIHLFGRFLRLGRGGFLHKKMATAIYFWGFIYGSGSLWPNLSWFLEAEKLVLMEKMCILWCFLFCGTVVSKHCDWDCCAENHKTFGPVVKVGASQGWQEFWASENPGAIISGQYII